MTPAESMQHHLKEISEDLAEAVEAVTELSTALESVVKNQSELMGEMASLRAEVSDMIALFKNYVSETNGLRSEVRKLASGQR